jgi:hypothetical protein
MTPHQKSQEHDSLFAKFEQLEYLVEMISTQTPATRDMVLKLIRIIRSQVLK